MKCPACRHENPATMSYCRGCGGKLDLTADEISGALLEKAKGEAAQDTRFWARRALVAAAVFFLIAVTLFVVSGGKPEEAEHVPSVTPGAKYLQYGYRVPTPMERLKIPVEE